MKVTLSQKEVFEAVKEWCAKRFPVDDKVAVTWKTTHLGGDKYDLEFHLAGVEMPPKEGPYR